MSKFLGACVAQSLCLSLFYLCGRDVVHCTKVTDGLDTYANIQSSYNGYHYNRLDRLLPQVKPRMLSVPFKAATTAAQKSNNDKRNKKSVSPGKSTASVKLPIILVSSAGLTTAAALGCGTISYNVHRHIKQKKYDVELQKDQEFLNHAEMVQGLVDESQQEIHALEKEIQELKATGVREQPQSVPILKMDIATMDLPRNSRNEPIKELYNNYSDHLKRQQTQLANEIQGLQLQKEQIQSKVDELYNALPNGIGNGELYNALPNGIGDGEQEQIRSNDATDLTAIYGHTRERVADMWRSIKHHESLVAALNEIDDPSQFKPVNHNDEYMEDYMLRQGYDCSQYIRISEHLPPLFMSSAAKQTMPKNDGKLDHASYKKALRVWALACYRIQYMEGTDMVSIYKDNHYLHGGNFARLISPNGMRPEILHNLQYTSETSPALLDVLDADYPVPRTTPTKDTMLPVVMEYGVSMES